MNSHILKFYIAAKSEDDYIYATFLGFDDNFVYTLLDKSQKDELLSLQLRDTDFCVVSYDETNVRPIGIKPEIKVYRLVRIQVPEKNIDHSFADILH